MNNYSSRFLSYFLMVIFLMSTLSGCGKILDLGYSGQKTEGQNQQIDNNANPKTDKPEAGQTGNDATFASTTYNPEDLAWAGDLVSFQYHPGYNDMNGGYHYQFLASKNGEWFLECCDQEMIGEPEVTIIYSVSEDDVQAFGNYLKAIHVDKFMEREDSQDFITDYSAWSYSITFVNPTGESKYIEIRFDQYKEYTDADYELMKEIDNRFDALKKNEISRTEEMDD